MSKYDDLVRKLKEIFQIDRPELDFGVYRILNARAGEINDYLDNRLKSRVQEALVNAGNANSDQLRKELSEAEKNAQSLGMNADDVPKVRELRQRLAELTGCASDHENAVFSHLLTFFSRYYDSGDFISQRRYKGDTYAIPYAGEEVVLHWANKDQYYTKSGENFANYSFKLADGRSVHFRLVAADTAKDNRKDNDKERRFVLIERQTRVVTDDEGDEYEEELLPVEEVNGELLLRFEYKPMPKGTKQDDLVNRAVQTVLADETVKNRWLELVKREPTEKNPQRTMLEMCLAKYVSKNSADYFIHKDLGGFLRRELDFYIKNEVMNLDDVQNADRFADIEKSLRMIQCMRAIALDLITFLAQLEDFQKKLWLKKKFVVAANYCVTLDRIIKDAPELLATIAANEKQWAQWESLGMLEKQIPPSPPLSKGGVNLDLPLPSSPPLQKGDSVGFASRGTVDYLREHPFLMADTALFDSSFKDKLLAAIDNLDESVDGLLIHGDNFQALNLLQGYYREQVDTIYIDPPYNTELDREQGNFIYKDGYAFSTWKTLMSDRIEICTSLLRGKGTFIASIDDNESAALKYILDDIWGANNFISAIAWKSRDSVSSDHKISMNHNYQLVYSKQSNICNFGGYYIDPDEYSNPDGDPRGPWKPVPLDANKPGGDTQYGIQNTNTGETFYPPNGRSWAINLQKYQELQEDGRISFGTKGNSAPKRKLYYKERLAKGDRKTPVSIWTDIETTKDGTTQLMSLFGNKVFSYPKPLELLKRLVQISQLKQDILTLDYFAGSGTTGHAVINLNRQDNGKRKYILVEQGEYFDTVLKPRIQKVVYSADWKDGKATAPQTGISHAFKVLKIESYEDTLNNLELRRSESQQSLLDGLSAGAREDYLLRYMLDIESRGSILSVDSFRKPFDCKLKVAVDSAGAFDERSIDLVETFNYLIGLKVKSIDSLRERGIVMVQGALPTGEKTLVLWRDCEQVDYEALNRFCDRHAINPKDSEFEVVYINGDHNIPAMLTTTEDEGGITRTLKLRQIEPEFLSRMFDGEV